MIIPIIKYLSGYVEFSVKGDFPERFLNQLAANRITFWDINRRGGELTLKVLLRDYKKLHRIKGKNRIRTKVICRKGLPFRLKKYRLRWGLAAGVAVYFGLIFYLSTFIWNVQVVGNVDLSKTDVLSVCKTLGLYEGAKRSSLDAEIIRTRLALELPGVSWASVNIEGATATVNISEALKPQQQEKLPCNLVAAKDGIIERLEVTEGTNKVKVGQTVKAGDMLVSGITEYKDGSSSFGPSSGKVYAKTESTITYLATFVQSEKIYIGDPKQKTVLSFFGLDIPLYLGSFKGNFEKTLEEQKIEYNNAYLPIKLTTATFRRVDTRAFLIDETVARELAATKLEELERQELSNAQILSKNVEYEVLQKGVQIRADYVLTENIAERDLLLIYSQK